MPMMRKKLNWNPLDRRGSFPYYYAILPVAGTIVCNMLTYYGSRPITQGLPHWDLTLPLGPMDSLCSIGCFHIRFGICVLGDWHLGHCPGEPGSVITKCWLESKLQSSCALSASSSCPPPWSGQRSLAATRSPGWSGSFIRWTPQTICSPPFIAWRTGCAFVGPSAAGRWDGDIKLAC